MINNEPKIVSRKFDIKDSFKLEIAKKYGAYNSIEKAFSYSSEELIQIIKDSGLRGKGGGGGPAGAKWDLMPLEGKTTNYLVVNCDESEPGTFKDRQIISKDPHLLIEGIIVACLAIKSHEAYIYVRGEYKQFQDVLQNAIDEAYEDGILGEKICGKDYRVDITIHRGAGAYICGEKSALLESLEGKRGHPRLKPHKTEHEWYFDNPTLLSNVETFSTVPFIIKNGADAYRAYGTKQSPGTLLFQISGHVEKPGVYEMPFGTCLMLFINNYGGGMKNGKKLKAVIPGGVSTPVLNLEEVEKAELDYENLKALGSALGTGGVIVMDEDTCMVKALKNILEFYHEESCGQCTPCRDGSGWADKIVGTILDGDGKMSDIEKLLEISETMNGKTICLFAPSISFAINSFLSKFRNEFEAYIKVDA